MELRFFNQFPVKRGLIDEAGPPRLVLRRTREGMAGHRMEKNHPMGIL
jgi:hypothetical protein